MAETSGLILCSTCFDAKGCERIIQIVPRATCENCGRECLGYITELPHQAPV
jgi:hypothetical protein